MTMKSADFLIVGGGVAGMSAAARLAPHGKVIVLEAESAAGYHSSGRSATIFHFGIGDSAVRGMTAFSREFFETPPEGFAETPLCHPNAALFVATHDMVGDLDALEVEMRRFTSSISRVDEADIATLVPILRLGDEGIVAGVIDTSGRRLDADALLQGYARAVRRGGGETVMDARVKQIQRVANAWEITTQSGDRYAAPIVINAAGAWADQLADLAGVRPLGLKPKRRTIIVIDAPPGADVRRWPFVKTAKDDFYFISDGSRIAASPVDEVPSEPTDARPEEYDLALAAWKVEQYTTLQVPRIQHSWAGLRSFVADRVPTAGFAPDADGFFWLAGQGGYGLQTAPAMSTIVEAMVLDRPWPPRLGDFGVTAELVRPERLGA